MTTTATPELLEATAAVCAREALALTYGAPVKNAAGLGAAGLRYAQSDTGAGKERRQ